MSIEVSDRVSDGVQENPVGRESTSSDEDEEQLAYRITWHCKLGSRTLVSDTETEVNWKMSRYFMREERPPLAGQAEG